MKQFVNNLKTYAEENPVVVLFAGAALITATAKLMDANTARSYAKTHALEVQRRVAMAAAKM